MKVEYQIILGALGVLVLISQSILVGFKIQEKRETSKLFKHNGNSEANPNPPPPAQVPGFAGICVEHAKKLVKAETVVEYLTKTRDEDYRESQDWRKEVRDSFKRVFDRMEK